MNRYLSIILLFCTALICGCRTDLAAIRRNCTDVNRMPVVSPDYAGITIPPNIAPLNFYLNDSSKASVAKIASVNGSAVTVWGKKGKFNIDAASWKKLLSENAGKTVHITIYARGERNVWKRYNTIDNCIAAESIDRYCTYRLIGFQYNYSRDLRECQRDLTSFTEKVLVNTQNHVLECVNCHTPMNNNPNRFVLQVRSNTYGSETLIADGDTIVTLLSRLGHTAWHPDGRYIAFSVYQVQQYFHSVGKQFIDVFDNKSSIVIYDIAGRKVIPVPQLNQDGMLSTWPAWSADGRYLYFCSAPVLWSDYSKEPPDNFNKTRYSLLRITYDAVRDSWGAVDTVLSTDETGLSIVQPKISPDNKFCLFGMQNYGAYPHTQISSDLYLMNIATRQYSKLPINSEFNESWHSWSKNSRWVLFSSKRSSGIFTHPYISYIDSSGNAHKPFIMPQQDPAFYESFTNCYNVPEFSTAPVQFSERQLLKAIRTEHKIMVPVPQSSTVPSADTLLNRWSSGSSRE